MHQDRFEGVKKASTEPKTNQFEKTEEDGDYPSGQAFKIIDLWNDQNTIMTDGTYIECFFPLFQAPEWKIPFGFGENDCVDNFVVR